MCPLVDISNPECAEHLTLNNIASAFAYCADRYGACPVYKSLIARIGTYESLRAESALLRAS